MCIGSEETFPRSRNTAWSTAIVPCFFACYHACQTFHSSRNSIGVGIDFTARDLQQKAKEKGLPWDIAKGFNGAAPISEKFIPVGNFQDLKNINFKLEVDGQLKQQGNTSLMLFNFEYIISYLSRFFTLKTGDLIFTGTPKGVGPVTNGNILSAYIEDEKLLEFDVK